MTRRLLCLLIVFFVGGYAHAADNVTKRLSNGSRIDINEKSCPTIRRNYDCDCFDPKGYGYTWKPDFTNTCTNASCKQWLQTSQAFCKGIGSVCHGAEDKPGNEATDKPWTTCFPTCDRDNQGDRANVCIACKQFEVVVTKPPEKPPEKPIDTVTPPGGGDQQVRSPGVDIHSPDNSHNTSCQSNAQCLSNSAEAQRKAEEEARERREEYHTAGKEARDGQESSITTANQLLGNWKHKMDSNPSTVTGDERARFLNDQKVISQAQAAISRGEGGSVNFSGEDALRATDPDIMRQLAMNADFHDQEKSFKADENHFHNEEIHWHALATETQRRADSLRGLPDSVAPLSVKAATAPAESPGSAQYSGRGDSLTGSSQGDDLRSASRKLSSPGDSGSGGGSLSGASPSGAVGDNFKNQGSGGLRDLLRKRLESRANDARDGKLGAVSGTDREALDGVAFGGEGLPASAGYRREPASANGPRKPSIAEEVMSNFSTTRADGKRFSLGGSETDAELRRLQQDSPSDASLLGAESGSLFERVHQAHRACLTRGCVAVRH